MWYSATWQHDLVSVYHIIVQDEKVSLVLGQDWECISDRDEKECMSQISGCILCTLSCVNLIQQRYTYARGAVIWVSGEVYSSLQFPLGPDFSEARLVN